eukprot:TRINITY_DN1484_c0_g1_i1.p1 TRINITY_DN1484_c0_g1~~TRINITY_DN1484_c0_g1_i1.p1  ORF type:complete len:620 (-),score=175.14 TRINITY_DN1484_c0_g1_i1:51-1826(-)
MSGKAPVGAEEKPGADKMAALKGMFASGAVSNPPPPAEKKRDPSPAPTKKVTSPAGGHAKAGGDMELERLRHEVERLTAENDALKGVLVHSGLTLTESGNSQAHSLEVLDGKALSIIVVGASGDLAKKKTYPALLALFRNDLLPKHAKIVGFARSEMKDDEFVDKILSKLGGDAASKDEFIKMCSYTSGQYDSEESFAGLDAYLKEVEKPYAEANRLFYFAIPPSVFAESAASIKKAAMSTSGWNRIIVEKPFGRDSASSAELSKILLTHFHEDQLYRIDHYLGKEMVQNLQVLRFANTMLEPLWSNKNIAAILITFKEDFGTQGRGGYFDHYGIIRDIIQNHLLQVMTLVAMDTPVSLSAEDVRDEKVKVLRQIKPVTLDQIIVGQYSASDDGKEQGYLDDPGVPKDSVTPTFAQCVLRVNNSRWEGVPFILKAGKALNERKAEVRVQFKPLPGQLYKVERNELVMRIQPSEAIYWKIHTKTPGLKSGLEQVELDLTYKQRFGGATLPDAYERLILDCMRGDHNLFVRNDELVAAWHIFTPILHQLENEKVKPIIYKAGSRGPVEADQMLVDNGYVRTKNYVWSPRAGGK